MFKDLLKTILLFIVAFLGGNFIALCQKIATSMPDYIILLTLVVFLTVAWAKVIKLLKQNS